MPDWEHVACHLCGASQAEVLFQVAHADAPDGSSNVMRCFNDGLIYLSPRPSVQVLGRYYPDSEGSYNAYAGRKRGKLKQWLWNVLRDLGVDVFDISVSAARGKRLLDVGCGYGDLLVYYESRGMICTGVDFSEAAAARGKEYGINILHGSLESQHFPEASFDRVILCHSLEHMPDPKQAVSEIRRVLKPGGMVQLAVPNGGSEAFGPGWQHLSFPLHLYHFTERSLLGCFAGMGFRNVRSEVRKRHDVLRLTAEI